MSKAVKFTKQGSITVSCNCHDSRKLQICVTDTGVGIPEGQLEKIFEPFVQVGRSLTQQHEGTGLGLAISRDLARAMGGDISVDSEVGQGSTFTLTLPRPEQAASASATPSPAGRNGPCNPRANVADNPAAAA